MIKKYMIMTTILCFSWPTLLIADEYNTFYAGGGLGVSKFSLNDNQIISNYPQLSSNADIEDSSIALRFFGGMKFDPHLSGEVDLTYAGSVVANEAASKYKLFDISLLSFSALLGGNLSQNIGYYGKLGAFFWNLTEKSESAESVDSDVGINYGLGLDINIYGDKTRQIRIDWTQYQFDNVFINSVDVFSLNILFSFG